MKFVNPSIHLLCIESSPFSATIERGSLLQRSCEAGGLTKRRDVTQLIRNRETRAGENLTQLLARLHACCTLASKLS